MVTIAAKNGNPYRSDEKGRGLKNRSGTPEIQAIRRCRIRENHRGIVTDETIMPDRPQICAPSWRVCTLLSDSGLSSDRNAFANHTRESSNHPGNTNSNAPIARPNIPAQAHNEGRRRVRPMIGVEGESVVDMPAGFGAAAGY